MTIQVIAISELVPTNGSKPVIYNHAPVQAAFLLGAEIEFHNPYKDAWIRVRRSAADFETLKHIQYRAVFYFQD